MPAIKSIHPNLAAWLDTLRWSEGTSTNPITRCDGYDVIVTGIDATGKAVPEVFDNFSTHPFCVSPPRPPKRINSHGLLSDAAGGYQLMARYWPAYKVQLNLPDFGPESQDRIAIQQTKECHAIDDILTGHFDIAVAKCSSRWASLPGNSYGQRMNALATLEAAYERSGGTFA